MLIKIEDSLVCLLTRIVYHFHKPYGRLWNIFLYGSEGIYGEHICT